MEFLKDVFGEEALGYEAFVERLAGREDVKLANLADGGYVGVEKYKALGGQLAQVQGEFERRLLDSRFEGRLEREILQQGGRSSRAVAALLDTETLKRREDWEEALCEAVTALKQSDGYLFGTDAPAPYAGGTGTAPLMPDAYRQALGLE